MRLIDADALLRHLNDMWLGATPSDTDDEETAKERRAICIGIDVCIGAVRAFPNADEWISVKDRLPDQCETVLVAINYERGDTSFQHTYFGWYLPDGKCWIVDNGAMLDVYAWMPLPEPPEEGT